MLDADKLQELHNRGIISEQDFVDEKHRLANKILRKEENPQAKSGIIYILLAWFIGTIGLHNFYAGYIWRGVVQMFLTLTSWLFMFVPLLFVAIWVLLELLFVNKSANGLPFTGNRRTIMILRILAIVLLGIAFSYSNFIVYDADVVTSTEQVLQ